MDLESGPSRRPHLEPLLAILCQQQASASEGFCPNMQTQRPILALFTPGTHSTLPKFIPSTSLFSPPPSTLGLGASGVFLVHTSGGPSQNRLCVPFL